MAVLRIEIAGNAKSIPFKSFLDVGNNSLAILGELDHAFSKRAAGNLDWFMNHLNQNGRITIEVYSKVRKMRRTELTDVGIDVTDSFVQGFGTLEHDGMTPAYLTRAGMLRAQKMTNILGHNGAHAIIASIPEKNSRVEITETSAANLRVLLPESSQSIGSVEGTLQAISIRKKLLVVVYESVHDKAVTCEIMNRDLLDKVKNSLGQRVRVSGQISRNSKSEPRRIVVGRIEDFKVFGSDLKVLPFRRLGGSDPNFTNGLTTDEFIRSVRG